MSFEELCSTGLLEKAKNMYKSRHIDFYIYEQAFQNACENGHLKIGEICTESIKQNIEILILYKEILLFNIINV